MARRSFPVVVPGTRTEVYGERDNGKKFILTELPAYEAERLLTKVASVLREIPGAVTDKGIDFGDVRVRQAVLDPALDELLWTCVKYQPPNPNIPAIAITHDMNSPIEEVVTRQWLRLEVLRLHLGFSQAAELPSSGQPQTFPA